MLSQRKASPQPVSACFTSFDQDWEYVGKSYLVNNLRSIALGSRFAWIWPTWTNAALFLPSRNCHHGESTANVYGKTTLTIIVGELVFIAIEFSGGHQYLIT